MNTQKMRRCLMCGKMFLSDDPGHRRCYRCNDKIGKQLRRCELPRRERPTRVLRKPVEGGVK